MGHIKRACTTKTVTVGKEKSSHAHEERGKHDRRENFIVEERGVSDTEEVLTMYHMKTSDMTMYIIKEEMVIPIEEPIKKERNGNGQKM